jgi:hypothetical protein
MEIEYSICMIRGFTAVVAALTGALILSYVCIATAGSTATNNAANPTAATAKTPNANSGINGLLTDQEIGQLQTEWTDPNTGTKLLFSASFARRDLISDADKALRKRCVKSGKVPYRVTCTLYEQEKGKKGMTRVTKGNAKFYVTDSDGKVVTKPQIQDLDSLCPS